MNLVKKCPICNSEEISERKKYIFFRPKNKSKYTGIAKLFTEIIRNKEAQLFYLCLCENCGFLFFYNEKILYY